MSAARQAHSRTSSHSYSKPEPNSSLFSESLDGFTTDFTLSDEDMEEDNSKHKSIKPHSSDVIAAADDVTSAAETCTGSLHLSEINRGPTTALTTCDNLTEKTRNQSELRVKKTNQSELGTQINQSETLASKDGQSHLVVNANVESSYLVSRKNQPHLVVNKTDQSDPVASIMGQSNLEADAKDQSNVTNLSEITAPSVKREPKTPPAVVLPKRKGISH